MLLAALLAAACEPASLPARAYIDQPQALAFRCVSPTAAPGAPRDGLLAGVPIEGCGCTRRAEDGTVQPRGRIQCSCTVLSGLGAEGTCANGVDEDEDGLTDGRDPDCQAAGALLATGEDGTADPACTDGKDNDGDGFIDERDPGCWPNIQLPFVESRVSRVACETPTCTAPKVDPETDDWIPVPATDRTTPAMGCVPAPEGGVRAYVGASGRGEVAVVDVTAEDAIVDLDRSIPGTTGVYVDDLVSDIGADPEGRFVFTVNSSTGSLSVVRHDDVAPAFTVEITGAPLFETTVYPPLTAPREEFAAEPRRLAWLTAPTEARLYEIDLNVLADLLETLEQPAGRIPAPAGLVRRVLPLADAEGPLRPGKLAVDVDGRRLYAAARDRRMVAMLDLAGDAPATAFPLVPTRCDDAWLVDPQDPLEMGQCTNGRDDDGDGQLDADDPECAAGLPWEGGSPCVPADACHDEVDNDADGVVDGCEGRWEGPVPACSNGEDDDGDLLADREDPDCINEADDSEWGREVSTCNNGRDDDGDGVADHASAPGAGPNPCRTEVCGNGEDDDGDALVDVNDPDCADQNSGPVSVQLPEEGESENTPCTDGLDNDGDGVADAEDPGCRFYTAARRFAFEADPACADAVDNDRDGLVDYPQDPDCFFAADSSEGSVLPATGVGDLVALRYDLGAGRVGRAVYALDRSTGEVVALDFGLDTAPAAQPAQRVLPLGSPVQALTLRQTPTSAALLLVDQDGILSTTELLGPQIVSDEARRPVFARLAAVKAADGDARYLVAGFYVVVEGVAQDVPGLLESLAEAGAPKVPYTLGTSTAAEGLDLLTPEQKDRLDAGRPLEPLALALPASVTSAEGQVSPAYFGLDDLFSPRGIRDPLVTVAGVRVLQETPTNVRVTAQSRSNQLAAAPVLFFGPAKATFDPARHPAFCGRESMVDTETGEILACVPAGRNADGSSLDPSTEDESALATIQAVESIRVVADDPMILPEDRFNLSYEGALPGSDSRSGVFGQAVDNRTWSLLDYDRDFCRVGVEPDDILLVDRFVPVADRLSDLPPRCAELVGALESYGDPTRVREPLRYRIQEVGAHRLLLVQDAPAGEPDDASVTERYLSQVRLNPRTLLPQVAPAAPVPVAACGAQFIRYHIRARDEQWLLTGERTGLRHPWVNRDGKCERHPNRADRSGRVTLGQRFRNEWFQFDLGYLPGTATTAAATERGTETATTCTRPTETGAVPPTGEARVDGIHPGCLPHTLDGRFEFTTQPGQQFYGLAGELVLPRALYWLPVDDRLYVIDTELGTIAEFTGFDPFESRPRLVRRYY